VQRNNIKKCVLDNMGGLVEKVDRKARKPRTAQKLSLKWMNGGNGRMQTKEKGRTTED
jgi:hypothetical protein